MVASIGRRPETQAFGELTRLDESFDLEQPVGELPKAQQQLVQIARAVATKAEILIFDEPTAALTDREADKLFAFLRSFTAQGGAAFYISHRLDEILAIADTISVMRDGRLVETLDPRCDEQGGNGASHGGPGGRLQRAPESARLMRNDVVLEVRGLTRHGEFQDVSFDLRRGEVLGIAGLVGSGRTEIGRCLFGVTRRDAGTVRAFGEPLDPSHPADAIARGLVYLPEERKQDGIFPLLSIAENMTLPSHARFSSVWRMNFADMMRQVEAYIRRVGIKVGTPRDAITTLSGGNQQKAILGTLADAREQNLILG